MVDYIAVSNRITRKTWAFFNILSVWELLKHFYIWYYTKQFPFFLCVKCIYLPQAIAGKPKTYWNRICMRWEISTIVFITFPECLVRKRQELQEELQRIEQRVLRPRGPGTKENDPDHHDGVDQKDTDMSKEEKKKRDKFAAEADDKEDSDGDDRHEEEPKVDQPDTRDKMGKCAANKRDRVERKM